MNVLQTSASEPAAIGDGIAVRTVAFDAPWEWLAAGWRDMWSNPVLSLGYGAVFTLASLGIFFGLQSFGLNAILFALCGGFLIVGPLFALGLYEISRRRELGLPVSPGDVAGVWRTSPGQLAFFGFILLFFFGAWLRIAYLLFAIFFGAASMPPVETFVPELLLTAHGLGLLIVGTAVGAVLAFTVYTISAVSVPLLMVRRVDVFTAASVSIQAVLRNPRAMILWAALIAATMACGIATAFLGLVIAFPLVGHATWHAFRATLAVEPR